MKSWRPFVVISSLAWLAIGVQARAADWPMLGRDGTRNPVSPEKDSPVWFQVPQAGERKVPARNIKWQAPLGTVTFGDVVVSNGLVWIGTNNGQPRDPKNKKPAGVLMCFRESDGKFLY